MTVPQAIELPLFRWIEQQTGLYISEVNQAPVLLALKVLAAEQRIDVTHYAARLMSGEVDPQPFVDAITTHESFFLRHQCHMEVAITAVIRPLLKRGVRPRILSAPCAQGEEPYSFLMLLQDQGIAASEVDVVGVDIAASSIAAARAGHYRKYALRQVPQSFISSHFLVRDGGYQVMPSLRRAVEFSRFNLLTESLARLVPGFHLIFSHNLLIYFDGETRSQLLGVFHELLSDSGVLFVDSTEVPHIGPALTRVELQGVSAFTKKEKTTTADLSKRREPMPPAVWRRPTPRQRFESPSPVVPSHFPPSATLSGGRRRGEGTTPFIDSAAAARHSAEDAYREKRFDEAVELYDQLIREHPVWGCWARLGKARVLLDSGEEMEAIELAEQVIDNRPKPTEVRLSTAELADAHAIIVLVLNKRGMYSEVKQHLQAVLRLNPNHEVLRLAS